MSTTPRRPRQRAPSAAVFGTALATRVTEHLTAGGAVLHRHHEHGMILEKGRYRYELLRPRRRAAFAARSRAGFATWLAAQSPKSLRALVTALGRGDLELITPARLREAIAAREGIDDPTPYGPALAAAVAAALRRGVAVAYDHRDYCGTGLFVEAAGIVYATVYDGAPRDPIARFADDASFAAWLAAQSDHTLGGRDEEPFLRGNQRLTRARLDAAVAAG